VNVEVRARNAVGASEPVVVRLLVPGKRRARIAPGMRVRAVWAGDGRSYDATVHRLNGDGSVVVNWLRPAPLSGEVLVCVCDAGGDDTAHRTLPREHVVALGQALADQADSTPCEPEANDDEAPAEMEASLPVLSGGGALAPAALDDAGGEGAPHGVVAAAASAGAAAACLPPSVSSAPSASLLSGSDGPEAPLAAASSCLAPEERNDTSDSNASEEPVLFRLRVRVNEDQDEQLEWHSNEELELRIAAFITLHRLKPLFARPLLAQAESMASSGRGSATVDIVDLI